jgi:hypothetical protein
MDVLSKIFAFCGIATIIFVSMIGEGSGWSPGLIFKGTVITVVFGALSKAARQASLRSSQSTIDSAAQQIRRELQEGMRPRFYLYLRPFNVTNRVPVRNPKHSSDLFSLAQYEHLPTMDFESILENATSLPLVALGHPGEAVGAGRIETDDKSWWDDFLLLARSAEKIFVVPSDRTGTKREIEWLKESGNLKKSIFICPPQRIQTDRNPAWEKAANEVAIQLAAYSSLGKVFTVDDDGRLLGEITIGGHDRSAVSRAISSLDGIESKQANQLPPISDETLLASLSSYRGTGKMSGLLKFVLIVLGAIVAGYLIEIYNG